MGGNTSAHEHCCSASRLTVRHSHVCRSCKHQPRCFWCASWSRSEVYSFFFGRNMQVLVKKTSVLSAETCTFPPQWHFFFQLVGAMRRTKNAGCFLYLYWKLCLWDGIQTTSDITCDEPAVNISGKLSLLQQVFTHYIIYIYIYNIIYIYTHASTYTTCTLQHQSMVWGNGQGSTIQGVVCVRPLNGRHKSLKPLVFLRSWAPFRGGFFFPITKL